MNLTSEQVHWFGGGAVVLVAAALLLREAGVLSARWIAWLLPVFLVGYGVESFLDPWIHGQAAPADYAAESAQHVLQGSAMLVAGIIEGLLLQGVLARRAWKAALPIYPRADQCGCAGPAFAAMLHSSRHSARLA